MDDLQTSPTQRKTVALETPTLAGVEEIDRKLAEITNGFSCPSPKRSVNAAKSKKSSSTAENESNQSLRDENIATSPSRLGDVPNNLSGLEQTERLFSRVRRLYSEGILGRDHEANRRHDESYDWRERFQHLLPTKTDHDEGPTSMETGSRHSSRDERASKKGYKLMAGRPGDRELDVSDEEPEQNEEAQWDAYNVDGIKSPRYLAEASRHARLGGFKKTDQCSAEMDGQSCDSQRSRASLSSVLRQQFIDEHKRKALKSDRKK